MKYNKISIITPYYPSISNPNSGIFIFEQIKEICLISEFVKVLVVKPYFSISRKFPFINFNSKKHELIQLDNHNVKLKIIKYLPFPKDTFLYPFSISISLFFNRKELKSKNLIVHTIFPVGVSSWLLGLKFSTIIHGSDLRYFLKNRSQKKHIIKALEESKNIIVVSEGLRNDVVNLNLKNSKSLFIVHNGVKIKDLILKERSKIKFKFLFVGSITTNKGIYELVESFSRLQKKYKNIELFLIGDGVEKQRIKKKYELIDGKNLFFLGTLPNIDVMSVMESMDCLVLPSHKEGFGRVIIEIMSLGKPVISTYSGGPEYIINNQNGILVKPKDIEQLTKAMEIMIGSIDDFNSKQIYDYIKFNFNIKTKTEELLNIICK